MIQPYTHAMHAHRCHQMALQGVNTIGLRVQVQKRKVTYCARIAAPWTTPDGLDCWTVESTLPEVARFTIPVRQVVECGSGCKCAELSENLTTAPNFKMSGLGDPGSSEAPGSAKTTGAQNE